MSHRDLLHEAIRAGAADLKRRARLLDRINVFPVVDADTGANMSLTAAAAVEAIDRRSADMSRQVLLGARGNSGVILAQFLVGFLDELGTAEPFDQPRLVDALARGRDLGYRAVSEPVEGTILTLMTDLVRIVNDIGTITDLDRHRELERRLAAAVAKTPELMPRLARAGVVDSGALGFHVFACGLTLILPALDDPTAVRARLAERINGRDPAPLGQIADQIDPAFLAESDKGNGASLRYCVNLVIEVESAPPSGWRDRFAALGASVDAIERGDLIRLHVHSDEPRAVELAAAEIGRVLEITTQDMAQEMIRPAGGDREHTPAIGSPGFVVLGDSSMSLAPDLARELGVARIENYVNVHGKMVRDADLDRDALFTRMRDGASFTTAQTSAAEVQEFLDRHLAGEVDAVYLAVGRAYTGTQELVRRVAADHPHTKRLAILDTAAASGQQGLAALAVARRAREHGDPASLVRYAERQIASCKEYLVIDDLKYLARSGRVGKVKAALAGALSLKPIVGHGPDGAITYAKVRSDEAALMEIIRRAREHPGTGPLLLMVEHTDNVEWAGQVRQRLTRSLDGVAEIVLAPLSSTSAVHMGPGTWGVAITREQS
jgi:DegV family protein with EDD domain